MLGSTKGRLLTLLTVLFPLPSPKGPFLGLPEQIFSTSGYPRPHHSLLRLLRLMLPVLNNPFANIRFTLNPLELIGLIGGTDVISAMTMIPLYRARRWLGWYNTPGSLDIARHLANFADSFQIRPYRSQSPTTLLGLDSTAGPNFIAAFSGGEMQTGHLGYLTAERSKEIADEGDEVMIGGRETVPMSVTLLDLGETNLYSPFPLLHISHTLLALIPITTSITTCLLCAFVSDWYMFSVILVGIFTSGFSSMVIGSGRLVLESPRCPAVEALPGRGILTSGDTVVVVRGREIGVNAITRGRFKLEGGKHWQISIWLCSLLYLAECLTQFVVIPQGTLFGQIMFVVSLGVSWVYSYCLASFKKERLQAELLFTKLGKPRARKFRAGNSTSMAVFVCLLLFQDVHHLATSNEYDRILATFLPDVTPVWRAWRDRVIKQLQNVRDVQLSHLELAGVDQELTGSDERLLQELLEDARAAFEAYSRFIWLIS